MKLRQSRVTFVSALALAVVVSACSASNDSDDDKNTGGSSSTTAAGGTGGAGGSTGGAGGMSVGGSGGSGGGFNPAGTGGSGGGENCLTTNAEAEKKALDLIIVWDRSGSMSGAKWNGTVSAVTQFIQDPASEGVSIGLNFFPRNGFPNCDPANSNPPQTPLTLLPMGSQVVLDAINAESPGGGTPMYGALFGTLSYLTAYQDMNPNRVVVAILASDGQPGGCGGNQDQIPTLAGLAQSAFNYNGVRTYAVAIQGSNVADLNTIAAAGGTTAAFDVTSDITLFKQKMEEIRSDALGCEYDIPEPMEGEDFDPTKLNMTYTPGVGSPKTIPQADNEMDCGADDGWYYDDPVNPTKVFLCPKTCNDVQKDPEAAVSFEFGCPTVVN